LELSQCIPSHMHSPTRTHNNDTNVFCHLSLLVRWPDPFQ